jgi:hypothetical protein
LIDINPKQICAVEARKFLKFGSTSPSLNCEPYFLVDALIQEAKETVNSTLKVYGSSFRVEE